MIFSHWYVLNEYVAIVISFPTVEAENKMMFSIWKYVIGECRIRSKNNLVVTQISTHWENSHIKSEMWIEDYCSITLIGFNSTFLCWMVLIMTDNDKHVTFRVQIQYQLLLFSSYLIFNLSVIRFPKDNSQHKFVDHVHLFMNIRAFILLISKHSKTVNMSSKEGTKV
jgi:hypothetical protein